MKALIDFAAWLAPAGGEPEPSPLYRIEPIILGPDGWMAFENPSRQALERRFAGDIEVPTVSTLFRIKCTY